MPDVSAEPQGLRRWAAESVWYSRARDARAGESTCDIWLTDQLKTRER